MKIEPARGWGMALLALAAVVPGTTAGAQAFTDSPGSRHTSALEIQGDALISTEIVREIDDPYSGTRWLLIRSPNHPGGPGRLVQALGSEPGGMQAKPADLAPHKQAIELRPVIRSGDPLIVEEHSAVADARLEATALNPAAIGAWLEARLKIGGRVVRVVAISSGHAAFEPPRGLRP